MPVQDCYVQANGVRLHYLERAGPEPPAILVHGITGCALPWRTLAEALNRHHRVVALDLRGHGESEKPTQVIEWGDLASDCIAFLDALDLRDALVVAHSAGGVAMTVAAAQRPERVGRLVLVEPSMLTGDTAPFIVENAHRFARRARHRRQVWPSREELLSKYRDRDVFLRWQETPFREHIQGITRLREDGQVEFQLPLAAELHLYMTFAQYDPWPFIARLRCPILIIAGGDGYIPPHSQLLQRFLTLVPQARVVRISGGTHYVPWERPQEVAAAIEEFLEENHDQRGTPPAR